MAPARSQLAGISSGGSILLGPRLDPWSSLREGTVSPADLNAALGARPRRLGLFLGDTAVDGRRELLRRIPYGAILAAAGERNRVDSLLLAAVVETESRFAPHAVSPCGAVGLMQLLPSTGEDYGVKDLRDPYANVDAGSRYLRVLLNRFHGRPDLAIAAYNTGPEVVARYGCVPPYRETQDFVKRVLTRYGQHQNALAQATPYRPGEARAAAGTSGGAQASLPAEGEGLAR
jgi:soluble lytic murein transglycosylase-like protein